MLSEWGRALQWVLTRMEAALLFSPNDPADSTILEAKLMKKRGSAEFMVNHCAGIQMQALRVLELDYALVAENYMPFERQPGCAVGFW